MARETGRHRKERLRREKKERKTSDEKTRSHGRSGVVLYEEESLKEMKEKRSME